MKERMEEFGVVVTCSKFDYSLAKGTCMSVRYFMPEVPVCLLVDGDFDISEFQAVFDVRVIRKDDVKDPFLKVNSFGWGVTKMIAFWESPFENFLLLDADTIVYGDIRKYLDFNSYDVILDVPQFKYSDESISKFYFNVDRVNKYYPDFQYRENPYVCTGVIFSKRGLIDIEAYKRFFEIRSMDADFFKCGEQGFLNLYFFNELQKGKLKIGSFHFQFLIPDYSFRFAAEKFPVPNLDNSSLPMVIHWAGVEKPLLVNSATVYIDPMIYFRKMFLNKIGINDEATMMRILNDEDNIRVNRTRSRFVARMVRGIKKFLCL